VPRGHAAARRERAVEVGHGINVAHGDAHQQHGLHPDGHEVQIAVIHAIAQRDGDSVQNEDADGQRDAVLDGHAVGHDVGDGDSVGDELCIAVALPDRVVVA